MKYVYSFALIVFVFGAATSSAQTSDVEPTPTPVRVVITNSMPSIKPAATPAPKPVQTPIVVGRQDSPVRPVPVTEVPDSSSNQNLRQRILSFGQMKSRIAEAKRQMMSRPIATASSEGVVNAEYVRVAFFDWKANQIDYVVMTKEAFLATNVDKQTVSQNGRPLIARTIRANGVNTPITLTGEDGEANLPLLVQYPVVREGKYIETAYYMSTHPGLVTPEVVNAGRYYVRNVLEIARGKLKEKGIIIQPKVTDIAERLAAVEHVDHQRFRSEYHPNIFTDSSTSDSGTGAEHDVSRLAKSSVASI